MAKIPNTEFESIEGDVKHNELVAALKALVVPTPEPPLPPTPQDLEPFFANHAKAVGEIAKAIEGQKAADFSVNLDISPLVTQLSESTATLAESIASLALATITAAKMHPKTFKIVRGTDNLITQITVE